MRFRPTVLAALAACVFASAASAQEIQPAEGVVGQGTRISNGSKITTTIGNGVRGTSDVDDFVFDGSTGQTMSVVVTAKAPVPDLWAILLQSDTESAQRGLIPHVYLYRPDGTVVGPEDGAKIVPVPAPRLQAPPRARIVFRLDQTGVWTLRVQGGHLSKQFTVVDDPATTEVNEGDNPATPAIENGYTTVGYDYSNPRTMGTYLLTLRVGGTPPVRSAGIQPVDGEYRFVIPAVGGAVLNATLKWRSGGTDSLHPTFFSLKSPEGGEVPNTLASISFPKRSIVIKKLLVAPTLPLGSYALTYRAHPEAPVSGVSFIAKVRYPHGSKARKGPLQRDEPLVTSISPNEGGPTTIVNVSVTRLGDVNNEFGIASARIGRFPLENVTIPSPTRLIGTVPANLPEGTFDVVVESTTGQAAVLRNGFRRVPPPVAFGLDPAVGTSAGGFTVTISGANFNANLNGMAVYFSNVDAPFEFTVPVFIEPSTQTTSQFTFSMPSSGAYAFTAGRYRLRVVDIRTGLSAIVPQLLELTNSAAIARVVPNLTPVLGGETMFVQGARFDVTATVLLEDAPGSGNYTPMATTFVDDRKLSFVAPARPTGVYNVRVDSLGFVTPPRSFAYYSFADMTDTLEIDGGTDPWDAVTTALSDYNGDGFDDLFLSRSAAGAAAKLSTSQTRVLQNDGTGRLVDVTAGTTAVMPGVSADDDWRADRIWLADVNVDSYPDIIITTNSLTVPAEAKSHTRILVSEPRASQASDRVFRDRTSDLMPTPRTMGVLYGAGVVTTDNWRAQDMWVGDLDLLAAGPPEIIITHDEVKEDREVGCVPYCASPYSGFYTYSFYWGGSRAFVWDKSARGGLGRYKFAHNFFPRKSGVTVAIFNPPPGVTIPTCTAGNCRGRFTPFAGQKLAVNFLDADGKPDIAVLANSNTIIGRTTTPAATTSVSILSPLQVAVNKFNPAGGGSDVTDLTDKISSEPGHAVAIGQPGFPNGNAYGVVAMAKATSQSTAYALRMYKFKPSVIAEEPGDFEEVTGSILPSPPPATDQFQASAIRFIDIDTDGDQDMVLVANAAPGGSGSAFRILRNEAGLVSGVPSVGVMRLTLQQLIQGISDDAGDPFDGSCLEIGDLDGDDALDFIVTRTSGPNLATRAIRTDK